MGVEEEFVHSRVLSGVVWSMQDDGPSLRSYQKNDCFFLHLQGFFKHLQIF